MLSFQKIVGERAVFMVWPKGKVVDLPITFEILFNSKFETIIQNFQCVCACSVMPRNYKRFLKETNSSFP